MERAALRQLVEWKEKSDRKPLIVQGARQVGKVEFMTFHPMSFYEFLSALGEDMKIEALKKNAFDLLSPLHSAFLDLLKRYFYVGGMPEAAASFVADKDYGKVRAIQKNILRAYVNDFSKHIPKAGIPKLRLLWESILGQLAKENKKFTYGNIQQGARANSFLVCLIH